MRPPGQIKREPRIDTQFEAVMVDADGGEHIVTVMDLSKSGFRIECDETFRIGEMVQLRTTKYGDYPAQIRWSLGRETGALFLEPVDLPE